VSAEAMPEAGREALVAFVPVLIALGIVVFAQWRVRRMAIRHRELHKAVVPPFPWPFVLTRKSKASPEFRREYTPFIRKTVIATWALFGLGIALVLRAAY